MRVLWKREKAAKTYLRDSDALLEPFTDDFWHWSESFTGARHLSAIKTITGAVPMEA
jgi:hypothetical protein